MGNYLADVISRNEPIPEVVQQTEEEKSKNQQDIYPMGHCLMGLMPLGWWYCGAGAWKPGYARSVTVQAVHDRSTIFD